MRAPLYVCLPYRDHEYTMVYAGTQNPHTDGPTVLILFDEKDKPISCELVNQHAV